MAATVTRGDIFQYSGTGGTPSDLFIRDVPDWLDELPERRDIVLLKKVRRTSAPKMPMLKAEWGWSSPDPLKDQLAEALDNSETGVDVDNGEYFQVGHIIQVDDEQMLVTGIASDTLTVTRGFAGTTAASHNDDSKVYILGVALKEHQDDQESPYTQGEVDYNYHQIFQFGIGPFSERAKVTPTYESRNSPGDRFAQDLKKKMTSTAPQALERQLIMGQRAAGSTTTPSAMGGLMQASYITTKSDLSAAPLTEYDLLEAINTAWLLTGAGNLGMTIHTSMFGKRIFNSWYNDTRRSGTGDSKMSLTWDSIETDMGTFKIDVNWNLDDLDQKDNLFLLNYDDIEVRPYASSTGWQTGKRATDGWYDFGFLRGDFTAIFQNPDSRVRVYNFSTTASDYAGLS